MHCPRCGQQQVTEEIKYCSRCGFALGLVSEILLHGGSLPQLADLKEDKTLLTRKNGVVFALLWLIFFLPVCTIIFGGIFGNEILGGITAVIGIFGSLMILIASIVLLKPAPQTYFPPAQAELNNANVQGLHGKTPYVLPPQQTQPGQDFIPPLGAWKDPKTGELITPASVTDSTTKLLENDD